MAKRLIPFALVGMTALVLGRHLFNHVRLPNTALSLSLQADRSGIDFHAGLNFPNSETPAQLSDGAANDEMVPELRPAWQDFVRSFLALLHTRPGAYVLSFFTVIGVAIIWVPELSFTLREIAQRVAEARAEIAAHQSVGLLLLGGLFGGLFAAYHGATHIGHHCWHFARKFFRQANRC